MKSWTDVLGSECFTGAALGCLTHCCQTIERKGESYRLQDPIAISFTRRGVQNFSAICRLAAFILRRGTSSRIGTKSKRFKAALNPD